MTTNEITGTVTRVLPQNEYERQHFMVETDGEYAKKYAFEIYKGKVNAPQQGSKVKVVFYPGTANLSKDGDRIFANPHNVKSIDPA